MEITKEMIAAGSTIIEDTFDASPTVCKMTAEEVFKRMIAVSSNPPSPTHTNRG